MSPNVKLAGKKVRLRALSFRDAPRFCEWLADPEVTKFLMASQRPIPSLKEEREWIQNAKKAKDQVNFSIDTLAGDHIGSIGFNSIDQVSRHATYGIFIGDKRFWAQGYGTDAGRLMLGYGFSKLKLHRIQLTLIAYNIRALRSYQKLGFVKEGVKRQHAYRDNFFHDEIQMGILKEEFLKLSRSKS